MNALVLHSIGDLRHQAVPTPPVRPGCCRVRMGFCGICGSDIPRVFSKGTYRFPLIPGHEFAGTIESVGDGVGGFAVGDRVAVFPLLWCGKCPSCEQGRYVQCENYDYLGSRSDGGFAEYVIAPQQNLLKVPEGVSLQEAAMTEPAAVALHALKRAAGALVGQTVAIFGAGPIGLMVAQWARAMGAGQIVLFDIREGNLSLARQLRFTLVFDSRKVDPIKKITELTGGQGAHVTIDGAGVPQTLLACMSAARRGGRVVMLGNPSGDVTMPASLISQLMRREVTLLGTWNSDYSAAGNDDDWRAALGAMASRTLDLAPLVTHRVRLCDGVAAFNMMNKQSEFYSKVLIDGGQQ